MIHTYIYIHTMFGGPELHQFASARSRHPRDHHGGSHFVLGVWRRRQKDVGDWWFRHQTCFFWLRRKQFDQPSWYGKKTGMIKKHDMIWYDDLSWSELIFWYFWTGRNHSKRPTSRWFDVFYNFQEWPEGPRWSHELFNGVVFFALPLWSFLSVGTWQLSFWQATSQQQAAEHIPKLCAKQPSMSKSCKHFFCLWSVSLRNDREKVLCWELFKQPRIRYVMYAYSYMYVHVHICALCTRISVYTCIYWLYISYMYSDVYICICTCK